MRFPAEEGQENRDLSLLLLFLDWLFKRAVMSRRGGDDDGLEYFMRRLRMDVGFLLMLLGAAVVDAALDRLLS